MILFAGFTAQAQLTQGELEQRKREKMLAARPGAGHSRGGAPEQDCNSAIAVCQSSFVQPSSYSGFGSVQEVPVTSCLGSQEKNSVWYIFTVQTSGTLEFTIDPNDDNDDYDFALYNLTSRNCSDIISGSAPEVRCNFCVDPGNTGISSAGANASEDCCTNSPFCHFSSILNVTAGQTYTLVVSNYSSSQSGYQLDFGGTANIFDNIPPSASLATTPCGATYLTLQMSEAVLCSSISPSGSEFTLTGAGGPFTVTSATGVNCGNATSQITINITLPLTQGSNYTLTVNSGTDGNSLIDNCGNVMAAGTSFNFIATPPPADIAGPDLVCTGSSATLTASQGTAYQWSPGGQTTQSITITPTVNTIYSVTVTNGTCVQTASHSVGLQDAPIADFSVSPATICAGQQVTFTNSSTLTQTCTQILPPPIPPFCIDNPSFYIWDFDDGSANLVQFSLLATNPTHTFTAAGTYNVSLTVQDTLTGGCAGTLVVPVTVLPNAGSLTVSNDTSICSGESATLSATGGSTYTWMSNPSGFTSTNSTITVSPAVTTTYTVTSPGCSSASTASVTVTVTSGATVTITPATAEICSGDAVTLTASGSSSYVWTPPDGLNSTTDSVVSASPLLTTVYTVVGTTASGCAASGTITVTVHPNPAPVITVIGPNPFCPGGSVIMDAGSGYITYLWSTNQTTQTITVDSAGIFTVTVFDNFGCQGSALAAIGVTSTLTPVISGDSLICNGSTATLIAGTGYDSYQWSTGAITPSITVSQTDTVTVTVTSGACSGTSQPYIVEVLPALNPVITLIGTADFCAGDSVTLVADGGYASYRWSSGDSAATVTVRQPGAFDVTVTDVSGCTGVSQLQTITVHSNPVPVITPTGPISFCTGGSVDLDAGAPYASYSWSTGESTQVITAMAAGSYLVTVTDLNNCSGASSPVTVFISSSLSPVITSSEQVCLGGTVTLDAGTGYFSYAWSTSEITQIINILQDGNYSVTVSDNGGCSGVDSITIIFYPIPVVSYSDTCQLGKGAISVTVEQGTPPYSYQWSDGSTHELLSFLNAGAYDVTVSDANACTADASVIIACPQDTSFISVPSAFSPNGDGKNDFITVLGDRAKVARYEFGIFNRWGQKVFFTDDLSLISAAAGSNKGWDGYFQGTQQDIDVFTYYVNVEFISGSKDRLAGSITLVR